MAKTYNLNDPLSLNPIDNSIDKPWLKHSKPRNKSLIFEDSNRINPNELVPPPSTLERPSISSNEAILNDAYKLKVLIVDLGNFIYEDLSRVELINENRSDLPTIHVEYVHNSNVMTGQNALDICQLTNPDLIIIDCQVNPAPDAMGLYKTALNLGIVPIFGVPGTVSQDYFSYWQMNGINNFLIKKERKLNFQYYNINEYVDLITDVVLHKLDKIKVSCFGEFRNLINSTNVQQIETLPPFNEIPTPQPTIMPHSDVPAHLSHTREGFNNKPQQPLQTSPMNNFSPPYITSETQPPVNNDPLRNIPADIRDEFLAFIEHKKAENSSGNTRNTLDKMKDSAGKVIVVYGVKGGVGKSFIATNIGALTADCTKSDTCIIGLDLVSCVLDLYVPSNEENISKKTIHDLIRDGYKQQDKENPNDIGYYDENVLNEIIYRSAEVNNLYILPGVKNPLESDNITGNAIFALIDTLRKRYKYVIIDASGRAQEDPIYYSLVKSDLILMVTECEMPSVRNTRDALLMFAGYCRNDENDAFANVLKKTKIIINKSIGIGEFTSDIAEEFFYEKEYNIPYVAPDYVIGHIPFDKKTTLLSVNQGRILSLAFTDCEVAKALRLVFKKVAPHLSIRFNKKTTQGKNKRTNLPKNKRISEDSWDDDMSFNESATQQKDSLLKRLFSSIFGSRKNTKRKNK